MGALWLGLGLLTVSGLGVGVGLSVTGPSGQPALCAPSAPPLQVIRDGTECVGVTDGSYIFAPGIASIEHDIAKENANVVRQGHYVTVALLMPLTSTATSDVSPARIADLVNGTYAALHYADAAQGEDVYPRIRLVLANEGSQEQAWHQVTGQLEAMTGSSDHLVAVIGMGISVAQTVDGARALSKAGIPMIGAVTTADSLDWSGIPGLARIAPSTSQQAGALASYLRAHGGIRSSFLVSDSNTSDLYTGKLTRDFQAQFAKSIIGNEPYGSGPEVGNEFGLIADNVCGSSPPPVVIYAGREVVLPDFIRRLQGAPNCDGKQITVLTGGDADGLPAGITVAQHGPASQPDPAQVSVVHTATAHLAEISAQFRQNFMAASSPDLAGLSDTWTLSAYDSMAAAAKAISLATAGFSALPQPSLVLNTIPLMNGQHGVQGATGAFSIDPTGQKSGQTIPIIKLSSGSAQTLSP